MLAMEKGGADIIELGVPFSDPIADGKAIQEANTVSSGDAFHWLWAWASMWDDVRETWRHSFSR